MITKPHFIILNGTSSAGKTSIARVMQENSELYFLHFQLDMFWEMVPPADKDRPLVFPNKKIALMQSVKAFLGQGFNLIYDTVTIGKDVTWLRESLAKFDPFIVAVKASLEDITAREQQRGDREIGLAARQLATIHENVVYDFEVNSSELSPQESATQILAAYRASRAIA